MKSDIPARLAENVNETAPIFDPTASANIPAVSNFGGIPGRAAKFVCRRVLDRRIVAPMFVPDTLQRMTLTTPTTNTVAGIEKPTTSASHLENRVNQPVYARASTSMNWENANGSKAYGRCVQVAETVGNVATKE